MTYTTVEVQIFESQIVANFQRNAGGDAEAVGRGAVVEAKANLVPGHGRRTGALSDSITFGRQPVGKLLYRIKLNASAGHADWVERGTSTPITPKNGPFLAVGKREGMKPIMRTFVHGQAAQHYLLKGMNTSLHQHGYGSVTE